MKRLDEIFKFLSGIPTMMGRLNMPNEKVDIVQDVRKIIYEWKSYKDLEEQGKLLELPCKVGDLLYVVRFGDIELHMVAVIEIEKSGIYLKSERDRPFCELGSFGKTVFFTRGEAESALDELRRTE